MADDNIKPQQPTSTDEDIYEEVDVEEGGRVSLTPGAQGVRSPRRTKKIEEKIDEQGNILKELKNEVRDLYEVVQELKKNVADGSEAFLSFNKDFKQVSQDLSLEFRKLSVSLKKDFSGLISNVDDLASESESVVSSVRDVAGNLALSVKKVTRGLNTEVKQIQSGLVKRLRQYDTESRQIKRKLSVESKLLGGRFGRSGVILGGRKKEQQDLFDIYGGRWFSRKKEGKWWSGSVSRWGRHAGGHLSEVKRDIKDIALASVFGPLSPFAEDAMRRIWESEKVKRVREKLGVKLQRTKRRVTYELKRSLGIGVYRGEEIGEGEFGSYFGKDIEVGRVLLRQRRKGFDDAERERAIGGKVIPFPERFREGGFERQVASFPTTELFRKPKVIELKDAELVQERNAKIHADKVHIQAKSVSGGEGGGGLVENALEVMVGGKLLGKFGRGIGRLGGKLGALGKFGIGALGKLGGKLGGLGTLGVGALGKLGGKLGGLGTLGVGALGKLGGRLGVVGQLGAAAPRLLGRVGPFASAAMSLFSGLQEGDPLKGLFKAGGSLGGALAGGKIGAAIGTAIAPGVGTAIGGLLGSIVGGIGGEDMMDAVYNGMKKLVKDKEWVNSLKTGFSDAVSKLGSFLSGLWDKLKEGFGWIKEKGKEAVEWAGEKGKKAVEWAGEKLEAGKKWVKEKGSGLVEWAKKAIEGDVGAIARKAETGSSDLTKAAGVVGLTKGDPGGMSLGMYQFTKQSAQELIKRYGYEKEFEGIGFGTKEFAQKWKELAQRDAGFAKAQQEFAVEKYLQPGASVAAKYGLDVTKSRALQEMVFARSVQHGVGGFKRVLENAFAGMSPEQVKAMSEEEVIDRVYSHIAENVDKYFKSSSPAVRESVRKRMLREKEELKAMAAAEREKKSVADQQVAAQKDVTKETENLAMSIKEHGEIQQRVSQEAQKMGSLVEQQNEVQERVTKEAENLALAAKDTSVQQQQVLQEVQNLKTNVASTTSGDDYVRQVALSKLTPGRWREVSPEEAGVVSSTDDYVRQVALSKLTPGRWREVSPGESMSGWVEVPRAPYGGFQGNMFGNVMGSVRGMVGGATMPMRNVTNDISRVLGGIDQVVSSATGGTTRLGLAGRFQRMIGGSTGGIDRVLGNVMAPVNQISSAVSGMTRGVSNIAVGISNLTGGQRAGVMDTGLVSMQAGVQQRVIDTDIRRGAVGVEAMGEAVAGGIGSAKMRGPGGSERVTMGGGDAFKNVPLYVDDLGILLMQLGLV
jgi:methyl-accepting chemotaxis protein